MIRTEQTTSSLQARIHNIEFIARHRKHPTAFTHQRKLPFATVVSVILRLAKKSLQLDFAKKSVKSKFEIDREC